MNQYDYKKEKEKLQILLNISSIEIKKHIPEHHRALIMELREKRKNTGCAQDKMRLFLNGYMNSFKNRNFRIKELFREIHKFERKQKKQIDIKNIKLFTELKKSYNNWCKKREQDREKANW